MNSEAKEKYNQQLELKNYSIATLKSYGYCFDLFLEHFKNVDIDTLTKEDITDFLYKEHQKGLSYGYHNQAINAIKFYYEKVLKRPREIYQIERPRKSNKLPQVLSIEEITKILKTIKNLKHKCIIYIIYSAGLRLGEVVNLKIKDIDNDRSQIFIR